MFNPIHTADFYMPQLNRSRTVRILLPKDYDASSRRYPVLYMQDGQNLFDPATAYAGDWRIPSTMQKLPLKKQVIVVGIDNGGIDRIHEYAPNKRGKNGGQGDAYVRFIVETLKPWVDSTFRTQPERDQTAIAGSSMGGLIALYAALRYAPVFGKAGILSPSVWFNPTVLDLAKETPGARNRIYAVGSKTESRGMEATMHNLYWSLRNGGWDDAQIRIIVRDRGKHNEIFWSREFKKMVDWLF